MQTATKQAQDETSMRIGRGKATRRAYGFDEIALVPGSLTMDMELCDVSFSLGTHRLAIPILASAMDGVVDVKTAVAMGKLGGLGVLNLQGLQTRYENTADAYAQIEKCDKSQFVEVMQKLYSQPVREDLIAKRIKEIKAQGVLVAASVTPNMARQYGPAAVAAGLDILFVQSTVTGLEHRTAQGNTQLDLKSFCKDIGVPVIVGNTVTYEATLGLMETGVVGILVGVGPGAACTSRGVLGIECRLATAASPIAQRHRDDARSTAKAGSYVKW